MAIEIHELTRYGWDCPDCGHWTEEDDDPSSRGSVYCESCSKSFDVD